MSKQRPSTVRRSHGIARQPEMASVRTWQPRVFHNSFTRKGRTIRLRTWSVKIQFKGRRETFTLLSRTRPEAVVEARTIYETLRTGGWAAALRFKQSLRHPSGHLAQPSELRQPASAWEQRLLQRPYGEARLRGGPEYSVRMDLGGSYAYFPLNSDDPAVACARAGELWDCIRSAGWRIAFERFERELTMAIYWSESPLAVTYTTLFSLLKLPPVRPVRDGASGSGHRIAVLEPDHSVHICLKYWLDRQPGFCCSGIYKTGEEFVAACEQQNVALALLNQTSPERARVAAILKRVRPDLPLFAHRIHEDSDRVWTTISGVRAGYILRRRLPTALFDPLRPIGQGRMLSRAEADRHIRAYFQSFLTRPGPMELVPAGTAVVPLTDREQEVLALVASGCPDKEIAGRLEISTWTVHNHLKNIYVKLGVHNRTAALMKHFRR